MNQETLGELGDELRVPSNTRIHSIARVFIENCPKSQGGKLKGNLVLLLQFLVCVCLRTCVCVCVCV